MKAKEIYFEVELEVELLGESERKSVIYSEYREVELKKNLLLKKKVNCDNVKKV